MASGRAWLQTSCHSFLYLLHPYLLSIKIDLKSLSIFRSYTGPSLLFRPRANSHNIQECSGINVPVGYIRHLYLSTPYSLHSFPRRDPPAPALRPETHTHTHTPTLQTLNSPQPNGPDLNLLVTHKATKEDTHNKNNTTMQPTKIILTTLLPLCIAAGTANNTGYLACRNGCAEGLNTCISEIQELATGITTCDARKACAPGFGSCTSACVAMFMPLCFMVFQN